MNLLFMEETLERNSYTMLHVLNTFKSFVEIIIPLTPNLASQYGEIQYYGAADFLTHEYLIQSLYQYGGSALVLEITKTLDQAAKRLVLSGKNTNPVISSIVIFEELVPADRVLAIELVKEGEMDFSEEEISNLESLVRRTMMGYYSEWYGYGLTRLENPNERVIEFKPLSWQQIEYPGPGRLSNMEG